MWQNEQDIDVILSLHWFLYHSNINFKEDGEKSSNESHRSYLVYLTVNANKQIASQS